MAKGEEGREGCMAEHAALELNLPFGYVLLHKLIKHLVLSCSEQ